jgi:TolA-binding protein
MAKHCDVCKQSYPEDHAFCPHCATVEQPRKTRPGSASSSEGVVDLGGPPAPSGEQASSISGVSAVDWAAVLEDPASATNIGVTSPRGQDSAIDLGALPPPGDNPASVSGASQVEWASLADQSSSDASPPPPVVDSPSDADLLAQAAGEAAPRAPDTEVVMDLSGASLAEAPVPAAEASPAGRAPVTDIVVDLAAEMTEATSAPEIAAAPAPVEQTVAEAPPAAAAGADWEAATEVVDVGAAAPESEESSVLLEEVVEEAGAPPPVSTSGESGGSILLEEVVEEPEGVVELRPASSGSGIDLGEDVVDVQFASSGSGIDLGQEVRTAHPPSESGIDLGELPSGALAAPPADSDVDVIEEVASGSKEEINLEAAPAAGEPWSSSVDLGSVAEIVGSSKDLESELRREQAARAETGGQDVVDLSGLPEVPASSPSGLSVPEPSGSAVDLGSRPSAEATGPSSPGTSASDIDLEAIEAPAQPPSGVPAEQEGLEQIAAEPDQDVTAEETVAFDHSSASREVVEEEVAEEEVAAEEAVGEVAEEEPQEEEAEPERELVGAGAAAAPPKPRGRAGAWLGGTVLGLVIGGLAAEGLWLFGVEPPADWRVSGGPPPKKPTPDNVPPQAGTPAVAGPAAESRSDLLRRGELDRAAQAGIEKAEATPQELALRGEWRWLKYLQQQRVAGKKLNPADKDVQLAAADLKKADKNPDAMFWLGHIQETTGQVDQAKATYTKAAEQFKGDAVQKRRFEAALNRLELRGAAPATPVGLLPPVQELDPAALAALVLIGLQPPPGEANEDEAGFEFWQAVRKAQQQDYSAAIEALKKAEKLHDRLRFTHLRKAQNPLSDPTEEIFLTCAAQLEELWRAQEKLKKLEYLDATAKKDIGKAVDELVKKAGEGSPQLRVLADRLVKEKIIEKPADLDKGVEQLLAEHKGAGTKAAELDKSVKELGKSLQASKAEVKNLTADLQKAKNAVAEEKEAAAKREAQLKESLAQKEEMLAQAQKDLEDARQRPPERGPRIATPQQPQRSESVNAVNPLEAEKFYADGLNFYFDRDYAAAERAFATAVENDSQDARYYYFLGLARLALNDRRRALEDLDQGAMLEAMNKPAPAVVSAALERVQGPVRRVLNDARNRPR